MAFIVHCGRCRLSPSRCDLLLTQWRQAAGAQEQTLGLLHTLPEDQRARLGLDDEAYARSWLQAGTSGLSTALSLQMLDWTTPLPALPPQTWHAMAHDPATLGLPVILTRRVATGASLARWLGALTGLRRPAPPDAHLGRWVAGRTALRLLPLLRPAGSDVHHDALRQLLDGMTRDDALLLNPVW